MIKHNTPMRIDIHQKKIALTAKYEIVKERITILRASAKLFRLFSEIHIFRPDDEHTITVINRIFSFFTAKYSLEMSNGSEALFYTVSFWKNHFRCEYRGKTYDVYGHRGRKFSIFKSGKQTAYFEKEAVSYFAGDNYKLLADDDADTTLLISFVLIIDNYRRRAHDRGIVNFDIGNIFQARKFDESWKPVEK